MKQPTVIIRGGVPSDEMFVLDRRIFGKEISWNVTRIDRDAKAGMFGPPERVPMWMLPKMTPAMKANIDWPKVGNLVAAHHSALAAGEDSPLDIPVLQVIFKGPTGASYRTPVDGNHRLCARHMVGLYSFECYVVPEKMEASYRVTLEVADG